MNNDYSWLGLYQKGYKLQAFNLINGKWIDINNGNRYVLGDAFVGVKKRYKHSIQ